MKPMSAATSPSDQAGAPPLPRVHGRARLAYVRAKGGQRAQDIFSSDPLRLLFPRPEPGDPPTAVLAATSGGLVGGDVLEFDLSLGAECRALALSQAAEKVYRSAGADSRVDIRLSAGDGAQLEWLPLETILFQGARLRRRTRLELAPGGRALLGEMLVFGRVAGGERLTQGLIRDAWEVWVGKRLIWADAFLLESGPDGGLERGLLHPAGLGGALAMATCLYAAPEADRRLDLARQCLLAPAGVEAGVTALPGLILARWLSPDPAALRKAYAAFLADMRHHLLARPRRLPGLWNY